MAFKMKNSALKAQAAMAGCPRTAAKMKMESAAKMKKSPMEKELVGKQHNLPEELKAKIEAAPAKMRNRKGAMDTEAPLKMRQDGKGEPGVRRRDKNPMKPSDDRKNPNRNRGRGLENPTIDKKEIDRRERENPNRGRGRGLNKPLDPKIPGDSAVKMVKEVNKNEKEKSAASQGKVRQTVQHKTKKPAKQEMPEHAKRAKAEYEADLAKKKAKADAKAESKRVEQENLKVSRERAKNLGMTMKEYEKHLRSKMLKSQRKRILGF